MRKYYTGTIKRLSIKELSIQDGMICVAMQKTTLKKDELFYKNTLGPIKRFKDKSPIMDERQAEEILASLVSFSNVKDPTKISYLYTPYQELVPYPMTKSEEKKLIKLRKKDKNSI